MVVLGRVTAPFGVRGWVKVQVFGDDPEAWTDMPCWWLCQREDAGDAAWQARTLAECKVQGKGLVARFDGVDDRDAAELLSRQYVGAPRAALPATAGNEYYWADLAGLEVVKTAGDRLGHVAELIRSGAHEVLDVRDEDGTRRLLPFVASVIKAVDLSGGRISVDWERAW